MKSSSKSSAFVDVLLQHHVQQLHCLFGVMKLFGGSSSNSICSSSSSNISISSSSSISSNSDPCCSSLAIIGNICRCIAPPPDLSHHPQHHTHHNCELQHPGQHLHHFLTCSLSAIRWAFDTACPLLAAAAASALAHVTCNPKLDVSFFAGSRRDVLVSLQLLVALGCRCRRQSSSSSSSSSSSLPLPLPCSCSHAPALATTLSLSRTPPEIRAKFAQTPQ